MVYCRICQTGEIKIETKDERVKIDIKNQEYSYAPKMFRPSGNYPIEEKEMDINELIDDFEKYILKKKNTDW